MNKLAMKVQALSKLGSLLRAVSEAGTILTILDGTEEEWTKFKGAVDKFCNAGEVFADEVKTIFAPKAEEIAPEPTPATHEMPQG